jgi:membrane-bound lytic murein transglycosylase MltF
VDTYFRDPAITRVNKVLFALAAYNAGPARIAGLRKQAAAQGLDPNRWFDNVELVVAKRIGRETVTYVSNIYKYYLAYQLMLQRNTERERAKTQARGGGRRPGR